MSVRASARPCGSRLAAVDGTASALTRVSGSSPQSPQYMERPRLCRVEGQSQGGKGTCRYADRGARVHGIVHETAGHGRARLSGDREPAPSSGPDMAGGVSAKLVSVLVSFTVVRRRSRRYRQRVDLHVWTVGDGGERVTESLKSGRSAVRSRPCPRAGFGCSPPFGRLR